VRPVFLEAKLVTVLTIFDDNGVFFGLWVWDVCCASMDAHLLVVWIYAAALLYVACPFWVLGGGVNSAVEKHLL